MGLWYQFPDQNKRPGWMGLWESFCFTTPLAFVPFLLANVLYPVLTSSRAELESSFLFQSISRESLLCPCSHWHHMSLQQLRAEEDTSASALRWVHFQAQGQQTASFLPPCPQSMPSRKAGSACLALRQWEGLFPFLWPWNSNFLLNHTLARQLGHQDSLCLILRKSLPGCCSSGRRLLNNFTASGGRNRAVVLLNLNLKPGFASY